MLLANETWSAILARLSLNDLASASLVSKSWQALAFPSLYRTVCLTLAEDLENLARRISLDKDGPFSIHIRGLIFDRNYGKFVNSTGKLISEDDFGYLVAILLKLTQLEYFSWEMTDPVPRDPEVISTLQTYCLNLKSVHWSMEDSFWHSDDYNQYFTLPMFKNLSHFALTINQLPDNDEDLIEPLATLLRASPDLESLNLNFYDWRGADLTWSLDKLLNTVGSRSFSSLSTFRAMGHALTNWSHFFDLGNPSSLWTFFSHHPQLHTVGISWIYEHDYSERIDPDVIASLLPALKHLEAPIFFCGSVIASNIADRLESLVLLDEMCNTIGPNLDTITQSIVPLPNLRKLAIHQQEGSIAAVTLRALLSAAPGLEELTFQVSLDKPSQLLRLLNLVPNLRVIGVHPNILSKSILRQDVDESEWHRWLPELVRTCQLLRRIKSSSLGEDDEYWTIKREMDGRLDILKPSARSGLSDKLTLWESASSQMTSLLPAIMFYLFVVCACELAAFASLGRSFLWG